MSKTTKQAPEADANEALFDTWRRLCKERNGVEPTESEAALRELPPHDAAQLLRNAITRLRK